MESLEIPIMMIPITINYNKKEQKDKREQQREQEEKKNTNISSLCNQHQICYDDRDKNGIKTWIFGEFYWDNWHLICYIMNNHLQSFRPFVSFFMNSPKDLIPCMTCRKSLAEFMQRPKFDVNMYIDSQNLPIFLYLLHNTVNSKLDSRIFESNIMKNTESIMNMFERVHMHSDPGLLTLKKQLNNWYEFKFWSWIQSIAFNFPADIQLIAYWNNKCFDKKLLSSSSKKTNLNDTITLTPPTPTPSTPFNTFQIHSTQGKELARRLRTYVLFFDLLKNIIHRSSDLFLKWSSAYIHNTPTPLTFSCRTKMLEWLNSMQNACHYNHADHHNISINISNKMDKNDYYHYYDDDDQANTEFAKYITRSRAEGKNQNKTTSFAQLLQILHPTRSI
jgi:hypothetical protein